MTEDGFAWGRRRSDATPGREGDGPSPAVCGSARDNGGRATRVLADRAERDPVSAREASSGLGAVRVGQSCQPNASMRVYDRPLPDNDEESNVIDRLREQIEQRLDQLLGEADRLRKALAALDPRPKPPARTPAARKRAAATQPKSAASSPTGTPPARRTAKPASGSPRRTAPGATRTAVLSALDGGEPMTAGEVADKAGLARGTVSTTLSKLAKSGEVEKAERGYRLPTARTPSPTE